MVWATEDSINDRSLAVQATEAKTTQKQLLLDWQQRITSLSAIINWVPVMVKNRKRPIDILFNLDHPTWPLLEVSEVDENDIIEEFEELEDEESSDVDIQEELKKRTFVVATKTLKNNPSRISVSDVFTKTEKELLKAKGINSDDDARDFYSQRIQKLKWIENYQYVMQVLDNSMSYEEVTEIFVRVNSLGIKLRWSDLALAQITSKWKWFMNEIEKFSKEFWDDTDYIIDSNITIRLLIILITKQSRFKTVWKISLDTLREKRPIAMNWLKFVVDFLRNNGQINDLAYLSSPFLLLPIAVYVINNNETLSNEDEKKLLKRFFLANMRWHYSMGSSESILDADLSILFKTNNIDDLLVQLKQHVKTFDVDSEDVAYKSIRSPLFSTLYFALKADWVKDRKTWLSLSDKNISKSHRIQFHHIFPKTLISKIHDQREVNEIANLAFIWWKTNNSINNKEPIVYFEDIIKKRWIEALTSQLIPAEQDLWKLDNYKLFLEERRKNIAEKINKFIESIDNKKNEDKEVLIQPENPFSNRLNYIEMINWCEEYIYRMDKYFTTKWLEFLSRWINYEKIKEVRILSSIKSVDEELRKDFKYFKEELSNKWINVEMRILINKNTLQELHDRYLLSKNKSFIIPSPDVVSRNQLSSIKETNSNIPFEEYRNEGIDLISDWNKIKEKLS